MPYYRRYKAYSEWELEQQRLARKAKIKAEAKAKAEAAKSTQNPDLPSEPNSGLNENDSLEHTNPDTENEEGK